MANQDISNKPTKIPTSISGNHRSPIFFGALFVMMATLATSFAMPWALTPIASAQAATGQTLTVVTTDTSAKQINGYYTTLSQNGNLVASGFSPASFSLSAGQTYVVSVQDYGSYAFDHWQDTGSTARDRSISISSDTQITAVYKNINQQPPPPPPCNNNCNQQSSVTIQSVDSSKNAINGYYTTLSQNGATINSGFTPATFSTTSGQTYTIEVQDYGSYYFNHWSDNGSTSRDRTFTATTSAQTFTAVYSTSPSSGGGGSGGGSGQSTISVSTVDSSGTAINGYYTTLSQNGQQLQSAFSPASFSVSNGQTYQVAVQDYGSYYFNHWTDGTQTREHPVTIGSTGGSVSLTAVYSTTQQQQNPDFSISASPASLNIQSGNSGSTTINVGSLNGFNSAVSLSASAISGITTTFSSNSVTPSGGGSATAQSTLKIAVAASVASGTYTLTVKGTSGSLSHTTTVTISVGSGTSGGGTGSTASVTKTASGLQELDSLTNGNYDKQQLQSNNPNNWYYYGSAPAEGAPYDYSEDVTRGLHLGVTALSAGQWAGFFAETPNLPAQSYHALLTIPYTSTSDNTYDTGLYVQTSNGLINYVTCVAMASTSGYTWAVVWATGNTEQATSFQTLWSDSSPGQPQTRDCTITTNGDNFLQVYLDNNLVYSSNSLSLQMPAPFNAFLEVQSSSPTQMLYGTYKDFYATSSQTLLVTNAPSGGIVKILRSGTTIASGTVGSDGNASIDLGNYHFPLTASIQVYDSNNKLVAATSSAVGIWGGDVYSASGSSASSSSSVAAPASSSPSAHSLSLSSSSATAPTTNGTPTHNTKGGMHTLPSWLIEKLTSK